MPLIHVTMIEGRSADQKRELLAAITHAVRETIDAPLESIRVWVTDVPSGQFMSAGTMAADSRAAAAADAPSLPEAASSSPGARPAPPVDPIMGRPEQPL